jgi:hypothetical protein
LAIQRCRRNDCQWCGAGRNVAGEQLSSVRQLEEGATLQVVCLPPKTEAEKAALAAEAAAAAAAALKMMEVEVDPAVEAAQKTARAMAAGVNPNVFREREVNSRGTSR